jgi:hypothetical protein
MSHRLAWPGLAITSELGELGVINKAGIAGKADNEIRDRVARPETAREECLR